MEILLEGRRISGFTQGKIAGLYGGTVSKDLKKAEAGSHY